jgi:hypothetical protein
MMGVCKHGLVCRFVGIKGLLLWRCCEVVEFCVVLRG